SEQVARATKQPPRRSDGRGVRQQRRRSILRPGRPPLLVEVVPEPRQLKIDVGVGPSRESRLQVVVPGDVHQRLVHRSGPAHSSCWHGYPMTAIDAEEVAMAGNVVVDDVVAPQLAAGESSIGTKPVQLRLLEEARVLGGLQELAGTHIRPHWGPRRDLDHVRLDSLAPQASGDRHAIVAVLHEVRLAYLVYVDRWHRTAFLHLCVEPYPPAAQITASGEERHVEVH